MRVFVEKEGEEVNGKSIMGLMMLAAGPGTTLTPGGDADQAISELEQLVNRNFEEDNASKPMSDSEFHIKCVANRQLPDARGGSWQLPAR